MTRDAIGGLPHRRSEEYSGLVDYRITFADAIELS